MLLKMPNINWWFTMPLVGRKLRYHHRKQCAKYQQNQRHTPIESRLHFCEVQRRQNAEENKPKAKQVVRLVGVQKSKSGKEWEHQLDGQNKDQSPWCESTSEVVKIIGKTDERAY